MNSLLSIIHSPVAGRDVLFRVTTTNETGQKTETNHNFVLLPRTTERDNTASDAAEADRYGGKLHFLDPDSEDKPLPSQFEHSNMLWVRVPKFWQRGTKIAGISPEQWQVVLTKHGSEPSHLTYTGTAKPIADSSENNSKHHQSFTEETVQDFAKRLSELCEDSKRPWHYFEVRYKAEPTDEGSQSYDGLISVGMISRLTGNDWALAGGLAEDVEDDASEADEGEASSVGEKGAEVESQS